MAVGLFDPPMSPRSMMAYRIFFVDAVRRGTWRDYSIIDLRSVGGIPRNTFVLARQLQARGHAVSLSTGSSDLDMLGVEFLSRPSAVSRAFDFVVSNNFAAAFFGLETRHKVLWLRNPPLLWKTIRDDYVAKLIHWPHYVHLSDHTYRRRGLLPGRSSRIIPHGLTEASAEMPVDPRSVGSRVAIFASKPNRNLEMVLRAWLTTINPQMPDAVLKVTGPHDPRYAIGLSSDQLAARNVIFVGRQPQDALFKLFHSARFIFIPGHREETFCNLALEAFACGLPVLTLGIGALADRVQDGVTGIVARSDDELGKAAVRVFGDDQLWSSLARGARKSPQIKAWSECALMWEDLFASIDASE